MAASGPTRKRSSSSTRYKIDGPPKGESFLWVTLAMLSSPAWHELIRHRVAHLVVERIIVEHGRHAGKDNGRLIVAYDDFVHDCSVGRAHLKEGIAIAEALGFIVVHRGRPSKHRRPPHRYALTHRAIYDEAATNDWAHIQTRAEAEAIVARVKTTLAEGAEAKTKRKVTSPSTVPDMGGEKNVEAETGTD